MLEAIGFLTVVAVILFLLINHISKPSPEEQKRIDKRKEVKLKEVAREESKTTFILQYKDFVLSLLMNGTIKSSELKDKLISTYSYPTELAYNIYCEMIGYGMIRSLDNDNIEISRSLKELKYLFPNFYKFCELSGEKKGFKDYSFMSDSPHLIKFINSTLYSEGTGIDILKSYFKFGIIDNKQAEKDYGTIDLFNNNFNLFLIANIGIYCDSYHRTNKTPEILQNHISILNHKRLLIGNVQNIERDLQIQDYQYIFDRSYNELYQSGSFKFIFG
jgi:hypothetical protein